MARALGRYELLRPLGRGGMAEVLLARRRGPGGVEKRLVVKRIHPERAGDARFVEMFVEEARLSMSLAHKNIVPVFDFGRAGDELFLVMELVDGADLGAVLTRARAAAAPLGSLLVAYVGMEALGALEYAHQTRGSDGAPRALVHRDITPRNVLVSRAGEVKLVDFGIATSEADLGGAGKVRGTPAYMSPEQARGDSVDGRTDLFSLGLVLWEALMARRAYDGSTAAAQMAQARAGVVPPLADDVPATLREVIERATAPAREARYEDARAMQLALDSYMVSARAQLGGAPPAMRLAAWLAEHQPWRERSEGQDASARAPSAPSGEVVTFLDDGAEGVARAVADATAHSLMMTRDETLHSVAETVAGTNAGTDDGPDAAAEDVLETPAARADGPAVASSAGGRSRWLTILVAASVLGGVFLYALGRDEHTRSVEGDPAGPPAEAAPVGDVEARADQALVSRPIVAAPTAAAIDAGDPIDATLAPAESAAVEAAPRPVDRPRAPARDPRPPSPPAATDVPTGTLKISATPWARVRIGDTGLGCDDTPCVIEVPAGRHEVALENPVAKLSKTIVVELRAEQVKVIRETLTR